MAGVIRPESLRHEYFNGLAEQFLTRIAKQFLGLRIDQHNRATVVDDDHRVRRRFQESAKEGIPPGEGKIELFHAAPRLRSGRSVRARKAMVALRVPRRASANQRAKVSRRCS